MSHVKVTDATGRHSEQESSFKEAPHHY